MLSKENISEEQIKTAYELLKEYCEKSNIDVVEFVSDKTNIKKASEEIHKELNFALRLILKPAKIEKMIIDNYDWILAQAKRLNKKS